MSDTHGPAGLPARKRKPLTGAARERRELLGRLLEERRGELGFTDRTDFARARPGLTWRTYTDLENGYRENSTIATLGKVAKAYEVTYDSMIAVAWGRADKLEPAGPAAAPALRSVAPVADIAVGASLMTPAEFAAALPYADQITALALDAAARTGLPDPPGREVFNEQARRDLGYTADDATAWDLYRGEWERKHRIWFIASLRARRHAAGRQSGAAGLTAALERPGSAGGAALPG